MLVGLFYQGAPMSTPIPNRQELEQRWLKRMREAELRLGNAREFVKEIQRDFPRGEIPSPDGNFAFYKAIRAESAALRDYFHVLEVFTALVLHGKTPDEQDWLKRKSFRTEDPKKG